MLDGREVLEMDYMKGYKNRNRRRRSSRRFSRPSNDFIDRDYRTRRNLLERLGINAKIVLGSSLAVMCGLIFVIVFMTARTPKQESVVSGSAVEVTASGQPQVTMLPDGVEAEVAAVATLAPEAIATPEPTKRPKAIALTFDDGPRGESDRTQKVLELLKKYNAHATFFVLGEKAVQNADILKQQIAQGCEIGNHSWNHKNLAKLSMKQVNKQYDKTAKAVKQLTGYDVKLLRPPYGAISQKMRKNLKHPMVLWNVDTLDWLSKDPKKILKVVKKRVKDGDIILMHDIHPTTATALEKVLPWLVQNGYDILTVSELAERKGAKLNNGKAYGGFYTNN